MKWFFARWALILLGPPLVFGAVLFAIPFMEQFSVPKNVKECRAFLVANRAWVDSIDGYRTSPRSHAGGIGLAETGRPARGVHERDGHVDTFSGQIKTGYWFRLRDTLRLDASSFRPQIGAYWLPTAQDSAWLLDAAKLTLWRERTRILVDSFGVRELHRLSGSSRLVLRLRSDLLIEGAAGLGERNGFLDPCGESIFHHEIELDGGWTVIRNVDCQE